MESLITELATRRFRAQVIDTSEIPVESVVKEIEDTLDAKRPAIEGGN